MVTGDFGTWQAGPAPIACLVNALHAPRLHEDLRPPVARHDDTAWVHVQPLNTKDGFAVLTRDLLDAAGAFGTRRPRSAGERHMARVATHWIHGPVRHVIVSEAQWIPASVWVEVQDAALISGVRLWLLIDAASTTEHARWMIDACQVRDTASIVTAWQERPVDAALCPAGPWDCNAASQWPAPGCALHATRVDCLLSAARRLQTTGDSSPGLARERLSDLLQSKNATVDDRWAATAAGRDFFSPAEDALIQLGAHTVKTRLLDVLEGGARLRASGTEVVVPARMQPALARQWTSRMLAGCQPGEPLLGVFDETPGSPMRHRAK